MVLRKKTIGYIKKKKLQKTVVLFFSLNAHFYSITKPGEHFLTFTELSLQGKEIGYGLTTFTQPNNVQRNNNNKNETCRLRADNRCLV